MTLKFADDAGTFIRLGDFIWDQVTDAVFDCGPGPDQPAWLTFKQYPGRVVCVCCDLPLKPGDLAPCSYCWDKLPRGKGRRKVRIPTKRQFKRDGEAFTWEWGRVVEGQKRTPRPTPGPGNPPRRPPGRGRPVVRRTRIIRVAAA